MLVGVLVFFLCVCAFVILAQYLNYGSSKSEWGRLSDEYNEMLNARSDRLRVERDSSDWLRKELQAKNDEIRRLSQKYRSPDVAVTMEIRQLFDHYGGPERTAAIIADNYGKLDEKFHELEAELAASRANYEGLDRRQELVWRWLRLAHCKRKNFQRMWRRHRDENRQLREELTFVRGLYEDAAGV